MIAANGQVKISWPTIFQGLIVGMTAGAVASYVLLIRLDERIGYIANRQHEVIKTIGEVRADIEFRTQQSLEDRRKLAERVSALEAMERKEHAQ